MVSGRKMPIMPMATVADTQFIRLKLRSLNSVNGTSGSRSWVRAWTKRNTASSTTPTPMISGMERNALIVPQL